MESDGVCDEADEAIRKPMIHRIVLMKLLKTEMDQAVFTKIIHRTPSDGAGRLERPMIISRLKFPRSVNLSMLMLHQLRNKRWMSSSDEGRMRLASLKHNVQVQVVLRLSISPIESAKT